MTSCSICRKNNDSVTQTENLPCDCALIDSVSTLPSCPDTIESALLYSMANLVITDSAATAQKRDSLYQFAIDSLVGPIVGKDLDILKFILADKRLYRSEYEAIRQPFCPNFAIEFVNQNDTTIYLVSFNTDELAVNNSDHQLQYYKMDETQSMARWVMPFFHNNDFYKSYLKYIEDENN